MTFSFPPIYLRVPLIPQQSDGECLAASAAMAISYLGVAANYRKIAQVLRIQIPYGAAFSNIQELRKIGLQIEYLQGVIR